ncbi:MAG: hypothetical protein VZS44_04825 [Bacilli bacterium]|nr:hypothetical protein [Bacilli bacterium]
MVYTSSYNDCKNNSWHTLSISKDMGKDANYLGDYYLKLAPKESFFRVWRNNTGKISEKDNNEYYIREFYYNVLKDLDPREVYHEIDNSILLCYEQNNKFCHRHIVAAWLELFLNIDILEVKVDNNGIDIVDKPSYIKDYLMKVIKESMNIADNVTINKIYKKKKR